MIALVQQLQAQIYVPSAPDLLIVLNFFPGEFRIIMLSLAEAHARYMNEFTVIAFAQTVLTHNGVLNASGLLLAIISVTSRHTCV